MLQNPILYGNKSEAPTISVSSSGLITATAGDYKTTKQLTTQAAKAITPTTYTQTAVSSQRYTTGAVTVAGDSNLVASNILAGKSIFGVAGSVSVPNIAYCSFDSISYSGSYVYFVMEPMDDAYVEIPIPDYTELNSLPDQNSRDFLLTVYGGGYCYDTNYMFYFEDNSYSVFNGSSGGRSKTIYGASYSSSTNLITLTFYSSATFPSSYQVTNPRGFAVLWW